MEVKYYPGIKKYILKQESYVQARVFKAIGLLEKFGYNLTMPFSRILGKGLFELRIKAAKEIRIFYCFYKQQVVLLHIFTKKTKLYLLKN